MSEVVGLEYDPASPQVFLAHDHPHDIDGYIEALERKADGPAS